MKTFLCIAGACGAVALLGANFITQSEAIVSGALTELKFEPLPGKPGLVGAPPKFKATKETIGYLDKLVKEGKIIEIQANGALNIIDAKK